MLSSNLQSITRLDFQKEVQSNTTLKRQESYTIDSSSSMEEAISAKCMMQIILNDLSQSYEFTIQMLTHFNVDMTFDQVVSSLLKESHQREHCAIYNLGKMKHLHQLLNKRNLLEALNFHTAKGEEDLHTHTVAIQYF